MVVVLCVMQMLVVCSMCLNMYIHVYSNVLLWIIISVEKWSKEDCTSSPDLEYFLAVNATGQYIRQSLRYQECKLVYLHVGFICQNSYFLCIRNLRSTTYICLKLSSQYLCSFRKGCECMPQKK